MSIGGRPFRFALKILVTVATLSWFFSTVPVRILLNNLADVNWRAVAPAFLVYSAWIVPNALRWKSIAKACGFPFPLRTSARLYLIGTFFNAFLPTGNGGDIVRGLLMSNRTRYPLGGILGTIVVERITGLLVSLGLIIITGLTVFLKVFRLKGVLLSAAILSACTIAVCILLFSRRFRNLVKPVMQGMLLRRFHDGARDAVHVMDACRRNPRVMGAAFLATFANQFIQIAGGFVLSSAIPNLSAPFSVFMVVIPLGFISVLLPSIGGYGVSESGTILFFGWFGVQKEPAAVFAICRLLIVWFFALAGAILFVLDRQGKKKDLFLSGND